MFREGTGGGGTGGGGGGGGRGGGRWFLICNAQLINHELPNRAERREGEAGGSLGVVVFSLNQTSFGGFVHQCFNPVFMDGAVLHSVPSAVRRCCCQSGNNATKIARVH